MRVSNVVGDAGKAAYESGVERGVSFKIFLDGVVQEKCITADAKSGYVLKYSMPLRVELDKAATEELYGNVDIVEVPYKENK